MFAASTFETITKMVMKRKIITLGLMLCATGLLAEDKEDTKTPHLRSGFFASANMGPSFNPDGAPHNVGVSSFDGDQNIVNFNLYLAAGFKFALSKGFAITTSAAFDMYMFEGQALPFVYFDNRYILGKGRVKPYLHINVGKALYYEPYYDKTFQDANTSTYYNHIYNYSHYKDKFREDAMAFGFGLGIMFQTNRKLGFNLGLRMMGIGTERTLTTWKEEYDGSITDEDVSNYDHSFSRIAFNLGVTF